MPREEGWPSWLLCGRVQRTQAPRSAASCLAPPAWVMHGALLAHMHILAQQLQLKIGTLTDLLIEQYTK